ncbi:MAG: hypothetical protein DWQ35_07420 [Planctomycetota bacterium]|nr:MAG: hypothetical protein DWQ35_07420 [Planctomycetota bacterium]REK25504.1 MAG: hypothetical protein DWQ42_11405 [Planctomycetota bacterium]REK45938.1 MAG: hypothetical protein DWQ46_07895 [Planctomycetota bacterium]
MDPINWHTLFFLLFAGIACAFALGVVFSSNVVRMAFFLIISLAATAGLFFLAGADFVGAMQLVLYVGGTLVLLVFGVMLTAQSPFISIRTSGGDWILAALVGGSMLAILVPTALMIGERANMPSAEADATTRAEPPGAIQPVVMAKEEPTVAMLPPVPVESRPTATNIGQALIGVRVDKLEETNERKRAGLAGYVMPFEVISIHLLVVLVGAAFLARARRRAKSRFADAA